MDAFNPTPPSWTTTATHALQFNCPRCGASANKAQEVWLNRRAPVRTENALVKWQEFYFCQCGQVWWAWNTDRPLLDLNSPEAPPLP